MGFQAEVNSFSNNASGGLPLRISAKKSKRDLTDPRKTEPPPVSIQVLRSYDWSKVSVDQSCFDYAKRFHARCTLPLSIAPVVDESGTATQDFNLEGADEEGKHRGEFAERFQKANHRNSSRFWGPSRSGFSISWVLEHR